MKRARQIANTLAEMVQPELSRRPDTERPLAQIPGFGVRMLAEDTAEVQLYGAIGGGSVFDPGGVSAADMAEQLNALSDGVRNIHVRINSPGGDVFDGVAIHAMLRRHPAMVTTYVDGLAASAASFIAQAGDKVVIARGAMMMIHDASTTTYGNASDHFAAASLLTKVSDTIADLYTATAGDDVDTWRERMKAETWYTAQEAVHIGLADEMTDPDESGQVEDRVREVLTRAGRTFRNAPPLPGRAPDLVVTTLSLTDEQERAHERGEQERAHESEQREQELTAEHNEDQAEIMMALLRTRMGVAA